MPEERLRLFLGLRGRDDGDSETEYVLQVLVRRFREDGVLLDSDSDVTQRVDGFQSDAAEVARSRERDVDELVEEIKHPCAPERDLVPDDVSLPEFESRDGLLRAARCRFLPRDTREAVFDDLYLLLVIHLPGSGRDDRFHEARRLKRVRIAEHLFH